MRFSRICRPPNLETQEPREVEKLYLACGERGVKTIMEALRLESYMCDDVE